MRSNHRPAPNPSLLTPASKAVTSSPQLGLPAKLPASASVAPLPRARPVPIAAKLALQVSHVRSIYVPSALSQRWGLSRGRQAICAELNGVTIHAWVANISAHKGGVQFRMPPDLAPRLCGVFIRGWRYTGSRELVWVLSTSDSSRMTTAECTVSFSKRADDSGSVRGSID